MATATVVDNPQVAEDGMLINPDALSKFAFSTYTPREMSAGSYLYPLNLYDGVQQT